ncbi:hypothetical protein DL771_003822 [Monosporascus sp. 5C6A]|nr:hypothetical protein DL771_003822 [Monosporascus sp. 5C6A]
MRLLKHDNAGGFSLTDFDGKDIPRYAILSHTWGAEEVTFNDLTDGTGQTKRGYQKIRFCGEQAERDGLQYFWVDTCCIDKSSSAELTEAINSMFRWYHDADKCYAYLVDVYKLPFQPGDVAQPWELAFQKSRWFTRGWTLQELLAPAAVDFFSQEGILLGNKKSLARLICNTTGIPVKVVQGSPLLNCSVAERMAWAERRDTKKEEDKAYSLLGIFDVQMPLIYGEGEKNAFRRLQEQIKARKGREDFSVPFSLSDAPDIEHFVAREHELAEMHHTLHGDGSRRAVVLHGLGGIGKTQLAIEYAKRHKDDYSAVFWLNIKDKDALQQSFLGVARQIQQEHPLTRRISNLDVKDIDDVIDAVKAWLNLSNNTRWLLIYDNYDNPKLPSNTDPAALDIRKFLPESYQGSVIITTRSSRVEIGNSIRMEKIEDIYDSLEIISNTSKRRGIEADPDAWSLAKELDGLPLALATAGAYLKQSSMSFGKYLGLYKDSWTKLQKTSPELSSYEDRTLYSTWQLSFEQVQQQNKSAAELLRFWAYFDNQDLWLELLQHHDPDDPAWLQEITEDELSFHSTIRVLSDYGMVEVTTSPLEEIGSRSS